MVEHSFRELQWRVRCLDVCVDEGLYVVDFGSKSRGGGNVRVEPSFNQLYLVAKVDGSCTERGGVEGGFFNYHGSIVLCKLLYA